MTTSTDSAAAIGLPNSTHRLAVALDAFLALTAAPFSSLRHGPPERSPIRS